MNPQKNNQSLNFHQGQIEVAQSLARFKVLCCGRRWGKTIYDVTAMINKAINTHDGRIAYIAPTFQQARDIAWAELKKAALPITKKVNESRLEVTVHSRTIKRNPTTNKILLSSTKNKKGIPIPVFTPSQSTISLRGWESVETLRGQKFHLLVLDEVASMKNFHTHWAEILLPTLTDYRGQVIFSSTPKGFNHFYDLYNQQNTDDEYQSFRFPSMTNPHLPLADLEKYRFQMTEDQYAQEYEADFRKTEGLVYKAFSREQHTYNPKKLTPNQLPTFIETFYGIDFGFTNPSAVLVIRKDKDANYWVTDEIYKTQLTNTELVEMVKQLTPQPRQVYADPAEPDRIKEFRANGYYMKDVKKGKGSIINGIQRIEELLKTNRIKVSTHCTNLISEFEMYSYPKNKTGHNDTENPEPAHDHGLDGLRMALVTHDPHSHGAGQGFNKAFIGTPGSIAEELRMRHSRKNKKNYD